MIVGAIVAAGIIPKQPLPTAPPTHTSQLIIDLLHEPSEVGLMEELDSIKKILDPKTPIVWLKEILSSELWEEELFQGNYHQIPDVTTRTWRLVLSRGDTR